MKSYILRIYRGHDHPRDLLAGTIEEVDRPGRTGFAGFDELRSILEGGTAGGRKTRHQDKSNPEKEDKE